MNKMLVNEEEEKSPFSLWLKKHREQSGISLALLREKINKLCSDAYLSKLENDKYKGKKGNFMQPDEEIVEALAIALNRPIDEARVKANYAPKSKEALEILETVNFSIFNQDGIDTIKNVISSLPMIRPELLKTEQQTRAEILNDLGIGKPNIAIMRDTAHTATGKNNTIKNLSTEATENPQKSLLATENAVNPEKNLLTKKAKQSIITQRNNEITDSPSPGRQKIVMKQARYSARQEPDIIEDEEAA